MAYFKDNQRPKMVTNVRPPLMPEGYQGAYTAEQPTSFTDYLKNPWVIISLIVLILVIIWFFMKK